MVAVMTSMAVLRRLEEENPMNEKRFNASTTEPRTPSTFLDLERYCVIFILGVALIVS